MFWSLIVGWTLMAASVAIHVGGLTAALRWFRGRPQSFWGWTLHFSAIAGWTVLLHLSEIHDIHTHRPECPRWSRHELFSSTLCDDRHCHPPSSQVQRSSSIFRFLRRARMLALLPNSAIWRRRLALSFLARAAPPFFPISR